MLVGLASGSSSPAKDAPRISLVVPAQVQAEGSVVASGRVLGAVRGGWVQVQRRVAHGWGGLGHAPVRGRRFTIRFDLPAGRRLVTRAVWFRGGRAVTVSATKTISIGSAAPVGGPPATASAAATPDPSTVAVEPSGGGEAPTEPTQPPATEVYWGAWIGNQLTGTEAPWDMRAVDDFEAEVGKAPSLIEFSSPFADCSSTPCAEYPFPFTPFEDIRGRGAIPFFSWSSQSLPSSTVEPEYELSDIADGSHDAYIRKFAEAAASWGHPFFLRFDWEMNGSWFPWGAGVNGNTAAAYVAAWRHVHQVFTEVGATNATWVWCPYVKPESKLAHLASFYPGDEYVDWTCLDGYNWGPSAQPQRTWESFSELFGASYRQITEAIAPGKPMLVGETASSENGGSKPEWITQAFAALPTEFPRIQGLIWFDKNDDGMDWPLESSAAATAAFAQGVADPRYLANSFGGLAASPIPRP
ncbi:MAG: hypothetical protein JSS97_19245 [Actinobacteria bacterium]|nr:hypothetical protein [Actinomycetota bacterium]